MRTRNRVLVVASMVAFALGAGRSEANPIYFGGNHQVATSTEPLVVSADVMSVAAFYDPDAATLEYQDAGSAIFSFAAAKAGLCFTVGALVWETTGPLTVQTVLFQDDITLEKSVQVEFLGYTRAQQSGAVGTTLETPWTGEVTGNQWMLFTQRFTLKDGTDPSVFMPKLFTELDLTSLDYMPLDIEGAAFADTSHGRRFVNFGGKTQPVPEPGVFALLGLGMAMYRFSSKRKA